jgi:hypothetical protein
MRTSFSLCAVVAFLLVCQVFASVFGTDIPGDGNVFCYPRSACLSNFPTLSTWAGTVASPALVSGGNLVVGGSTLGLQITTSTVTLTFSDPPPANPDVSGIVGPLGFNNLFNPVKISPNGTDARRDSTIPISGQQLTLNIKNTASVPLTEIDFYLQSMAAVLPNGQTDGLTFGVYCTGLPDSFPQCSPSMSPQNIKLLMTPTGPGTLNPTDLSPANNNKTFGDLLRFTGINLAPNATGTFSFYITDYNGTRDPNTGGTTPNATFTLQIVPTPVPTYTISGQVTLTGSGQSGVAVALSGSATNSAMTDGSGNYSFTGLVAGNYTVTPSKTGYNFTPPSQTFNNLSANQTANFTSAVATYSISGQVTLTGSGQSGVAVALSGSATNSAMTDGSGNYSFTGLVAGNYTVTPSKAGYNFTPASLTFNNLSANQTANFTSAVAPFSISGQVTLNGSGQSGVAVALSGSATNSAMTDGSGNYSFTGLVNGNYTVTPSKTGYNFTPASQTFNNLSANQTANFTSAVATYSISGQVTLNGSGQIGVAVALSGSATNSAMTDGSGNYSFTGLVSGNYTVTPSKTGYNFTPPSQTFNNLSANQTANFTSAVAATYYIFGQVTLAGSGQSGVAVALSGGANNSTMTDVAGNYSFTGLLAGNYTVTPSKAGYNFAPLSQTFNNLNANQTANFTATSGTYSISGQVTLAGSGQSGVAVALSGSATNSTMTDGSGNYSFSGLMAGNYTVTPSKAGYGFTPPSQTFNNFNANQTANFTAMAGTYSISGHVTLAGSGQSGVAVALSGSVNSSTMTDGSGNYSFSGLVAGNYTVTPSKTGYAFTPPSQTLNNLNANQTANFTATAGTYSISGQVTLAGSGQSGVAVALSGSVSSSTMTDGSGNYSFTGLVTGNYTVTPSQAGYTFAPPSTTFNALTVNQTANFTATMVTYSISGQVTLSGSGQSGVTLILSGSATTTMTTDGSGNYSLSGLSPGNYIVTPSKPGYNFAPVSQTFNNLNTNLTANFTATVATYSITGKVTLAGSGQSGVAMALSGSTNASMMTDGSGNYSFTGLVLGNYTVTPSKSGFTYTPLSQTFNNMSASQTANFTTGFPIYTISGQVTLNGAGQSGVTVTLFGTAINSTLTDSSGNYSFTGLLAGNYVLTPSKSGYSFTPSSATFNALSANQTANFTATFGITMSLSQSTLNFGVNGSFVTSPQTVALSFTAGADIFWTASACPSNVIVAPNSGHGNTNVQVSALAGPGCTVTFTTLASGVNNPTIQLRVNVNNLATGPPYGFFDIPLDNTTGVSGAIAVGGWALDSVEVTSVSIWRESVGSEPLGNLIFIGNATLVSGARPDVQAISPAVPFNYRAGWGYALLTNFLPNSIGTGTGNGTYKLHAIVTNKAGATVDLGTRTISVDNAHATKPFGTIDTPTQGGTASGSAFVNFAWALTQQPNIIPTDGSTITVIIDGQQVGHPTYNQFRSDIATLFPGYMNSNGAVGYYFLDTTKLANGAHTISWNVFDSANHSEGIGSRYFNVTNAGSGIAAPEEAPLELTRPDTMRLRSGFDLNRPSELLLADENGVLTVDMPEMGRIEFEVGASEGYMLANGERQPLPIGSSMKDGVFYWLAGPGLLGEYQLVFERPDSSSVRLKVTVRPKQFDR